MQFRSVLSQAYSIEALHDVSGLPDDYITILSYDALLLGEVTTSFVVWNRNNQLRCMFKSFL